MAKSKFHLRSRFHLSGVFWDAFKPEFKFSAIISSNGRYVEFQTSAELVEPNESFLTASSASAPDIVHGYITEGECTLIGLQEMSAPGLIDFPNKRGVQTRKYRVGACVIGCYLESDTQPLLDSVTLRFSGIGEWLPAPAVISFAAEGNSVFFPARPLKILDIPVPAHSIRVSIKVNQNPTYRPAGRNVIAKSDPILVIEATERRSLEWFVDLAYRFENFFSLCLGTSVRLNSLLLKSGEREGWLILSKKGKAQKPDPRVWIAADAAQLANAVTAWLSASEEFRFLENLIYGAIRHSSLFVETEFILLAQAIESLHRLTDTSTVTDPDIFKRALKQLCKLISDTCGTSAIGARLLDSIRHANEPSFQIRVQSLLSRINPERATKLLSDLAVFEQSLRQTRNHFTHPGIRKKSKVIIKAKELFLFNQRLHALLRLLMLLHLGFSEEKVFEPIYQQSRQWT